MNTTATQPQAGKPEKKLTKYMMANIAILSSVGFISIILLLFGDFDDKGMRVFSTFLAFLVFTAFTAMDTSFKRPATSIPLATATNILVLSLSLVGIWGSLTQSRGDYYYNDGLEGFIGVIGLAIVGRLGSMIVQKILQFVPSDNNSVSLASKIGAGSFGISTVLFLLPIGFNFIEFHDFYWRITVAFVLISGVIISVLTLLIWSFRTEGQGNPFRNPALPAESPREVTETPNVKEQGTQQPKYAEPRSVVTESRPADYSTPSSITLSWPVFPNGLPLPALSNGRPDFNALQVVTAMHIAAEKQFFDN